MRVNGEKINGLIFVQPKMPSCFLFCLCWCLRCVGGGGVGVFKLGCVFGGFGENSQVVIAFQA